MCALIPPPFFLTARNPPPNITELACLIFLSFAFVHSFASSLHSTIKSLRVTDAVASQDTASEAMVPEGNTRTLVTAPKDGNAHEVVDAIGLNVQALGLTTQAQRHEERNSCEAADED